MTRIDLTRIDLTRVDLELKHFQGRREEEGEGEIFEIDVRFSLKDFRILPNEFRFFFGFELLFVVAEVTQVRILVTAAVKSLTCYRPAQMWASLPRARAEIHHLFFIGIV